MAGFSSSAHYISIVSKWSCVSLGQHSVWSSISLHICLLSKALFLWTKLKQQVSFKGIVHYSFKWMCHIIILQLKAVSLFKTYLARGIFVIYSAVKHQRKPLKTNPWKQSFKNKEKKNNPSSLHPLIKGVVGAFYFLWKLIKHRCLLS